MIPQSNSQNPLLNTYKRELSQKLETPMMGKRKPEADEKPIAFASLDSLNVDFVEQKPTPERYEGFFEVFGTASLPLPETERALMEELGQKMESLTSAKKEDMMLFLHGYDEFNEEQFGHIAGATIAVKEGRQLTKVYEIGLHDTPELAGGLLAIRETDFEPLTKTLFAAGKGRNFMNYEKGWRVRE